MIIIPAIDLQESKCVRLKQGDFTQSELFSEDPIAQAKFFAAQQIQRLHIVDLNGAKEGHPVHQKMIEKIVTELPDIEIQIGGGIRTEASGKSYLDAGAKYIILGTEAIRNPNFLHTMCDNHPGQIILGLDTYNEKIATQGWQTKSNMDMMDFIEKINTLKGLKAILHTDIQKDGMMSGVGLSSTTRLAQACNFQIIASGGVAGMKDIQALAALPCNNIEGVVVGRALYEKKLDLKTAQKYLNQHAV